MMLKPTLLLAAALGAFTANAATFVQDYSLSPMERTTGAGYVRSEYNREALDQRSREEARGRGERGQKFEAGAALEVMEDAASRPSGLPF